MIDLARDHLPWLLSAITVWQLFLTGERKPYAWAIMLGNQGFWLVWIIATATWGLLPMNLALWIVAFRNHRKWAAEAKGAKRTRQTLPRLGPLIRQIRSAYATDWATDKTARGFAQHTFKDRYGKSVRLQESSLATEPCIWIFPEVEMVQGQPACGAHLTPAMARDVANRLMGWANAQTEMESRND